MDRNWLLITISTPGGSSTLRVWAWRRLRALGAHYLQQSVCLLPATAETRRAVNRVVARLAEEGGQGRALEIALVGAEQEAAVIEAFQGERSDEYGEVVERTGEFHGELAKELGRGRATYTELEESDADLARLKRWLAAIEARDYFDAPGRGEAEVAVERCEQALAEFESEAINSEIGTGRDE
ncbi:MAG: hypothetical protein JST31_06950 [Actinobacteria bacterium]|nr:hypothetical protein [Actinomycetota bacterium]